MAADTSCSNSVSVCHELGNPRASLFEKLGIRPKNLFFSQLAPKRTTRFHNVWLCLYVADPATFPSFRQCSDDLIFLCEQLVFIKIWKKTYLSLCDYLSNSVNIKILSSNYIVCFQAEGFAHKNLENVFVMPESWPALLSVSRVPCCSTKGGGGGGGYVAWRRKGV